MPTHTKELQQFLKELNGRRKSYEQKAPPFIRELYRRETKDNGIFNDSSFLFIRSYDGDTGVRPFSNIVYWNSPDMSLLPATGTTPVTTNTIDAGETYVLRCRLHNKGDVLVPFPKVEFFLTNPSLGFDVRFATQLGATLMQGLLLPNGNGSADLTYHVPADEGGHKCLFARTFSFSPLDKPYDMYALDPRTDRHIAQKNLNIVEQATPYFFNLIHLPNASEKIEFVNLSINEIMALGEPLLAKYKWKEKISPSLFKEAKIEITESGKSVVIRPGAQGFDVTSEGDGLTLKQQVIIFKSVNKAIAQINAGKAKFSQFKELFQNNKNMNEPMQKTSLRMQIPKLNLKPGEASAWNIINTNNTTGEIKGGITIVVRG